jgi:hypothetical protein
MDDSFDAFDPERFRLSPEMAAELARAKAERDASKRKGNKPEWLADKIAATSARPGRAAKTNRDDLFVQILHRAVAAGGRALHDKQWMVWLYIHYRALWDKTNTVEIGNKTLKEWGVGRTVKNRALYAFERAGLITVDWRGRKSPVVTLRPDLSMWRGCNGSGT